MPETATCTGFDKILLCRSILLLVEEMKFQDLDTNFQPDYDLKTRLDNSLQGFVAPKILFIWIKFLHFQLSDINVWPTRPAIGNHIPLGLFKMYPDT